MPTCTPGYGLPYITGSDRPCDQSETWCDFTAAVDTQLGLLDDIVDRTIDTIPQAQVRMTVPRSQPNDPGGGTPQFVPFDTVDVDTANMVDLAASPFLITLPRFGIYFIYFTVDGTTAGAGGVWTAQGNTPPIGAFPAGFVPSVARQVYLDDGSTPVSLSSSGLYRYVSPVAGAAATTSNPQLVLRVSAPDRALPLTNATFGAYWMRDLP